MCIRDSLQTYENFEKLSKTWRKLSKNFAKHARVPSLMANQSIDLSMQVGPVGLVGISKRKRGATEGRYANRIVIEGHKIDAVT